MLKDVQLSGQASQDRYVISSVLISSLFQLYGCGPVRALKPPSDETSEFKLKSTLEDLAESDARHDKYNVPMPAEQLGLKIRFGGNLPDGRRAIGIPTTDPHLQIPHDYEMRAGRNQICSSGILRLPGSTELYFVWSEEALGSTIIHAEYSHQILSVGNRWLFNREVTSATLDRRSHQWYISISNLLRNGRIYSQNRVRDADTQFLNLDLTLANFKIVGIEISFTANDSERISFLQQYY